MISGPLLQIKSLKKNVYDKNILHNLDYTFEHGSITWIKGSEQAGKSLLTNILCQVEQPDEGSVTWTTDAGRSMGVVFDVAALVSNLSIAQNLALAIDHYRVYLGGTEKNEFIKKTLGEWKLENSENLRPVALSKSQCFKVALIRALIAKPKALIWDDAFECFGEDDLRLVQNKLKEAHRSGTALILLSRRPGLKWDDTCKEITLAKGRLEA